MAPTCARLENVEKGEPIASREMEGAQKKGAQPKLRPVVIPFVWAMRTLPPSPGGVSPLVAWRVSLPDTTAPRHDRDVLSAPSVWAAKSLLAKSIRAMRALPLPPGGVSEMNGETPAFIRHPISLPGRSLSTSMQLGGANALLAKHFGTTRLVHHPRTRTVHLSALQKQTQAKKG